MTSRNLENDLEHKVQECVEQLKSTFADIASNLAEVLADQEMQQPNQLMPKKAYIERYELQIARELATTQERLKKGPKMLIQALAEMSQDNSIDNDLIQELYKLTALASMIANERQQFISELGLGKTIQAIAGLSDSSLEKLYQAAKHVFDQKRFSEAADAFGFLTMLNPTKFAFWLGLGNSEFNLKNYEAALFAYAFVCRINPQDYFGHIFSCRCYEALGDMKNAINALEMALDIIGNDPAKKELRHMLEAQIKQLGTLSK